MARIKEIQKDKFEWLKKNIKRYPPARYFNHYTISIIASDMTALGFYSDKTGISDRINSIEKLIRKNYEIIYS